MSPGIRSDCRFLSRDIAGHNGKLRDYADYLCFSVVNFRSALQYREVTNQSFTMQMPEKRANPVTIRRSRAKLPVISRKMPETWSGAPRLGKK
jgi:hypothetical protein